MERSKSFGPRPHVSFEVQKVIGISSDGNYQVQWAPAWVNKFHLVGCEHLIQEFLQQQAEIADPEICSQLPYSQISEQESKIHASQNQSSYDTFLANDIHLDTPCNNGMEQLSAGDGATQEILYESCNIDTFTTLEENDKVKVKIEEEDKEEIIIISEGHPSVPNESSVPSSTHPEETISNDCSSVSEIHTELPGAWPEQERPDDKLRTQETPSDTNIVPNQTPPPSTPSQHTCEVCGKHFYCRSMLAVHSRSHSGEKPYECTYCEKRFSIKTHLKTHIRIHTGEQPYSCTQCSFKCSDQSSLTRHLRRHTGERPYKCELCGKTFTRRYLLKQHQVIHGTGV